MIRSWNLTRRLVLLCALLTCLMAVTTGFSLNNDRPNRAYLPCCSACDVENPPLICQRGCSPGCKQ